MQVQPAIPIRISQAVSLEPNVVPEYGAALKQGCRRGKGHQGGSGAEQHINTSSSTSTLQGEVHLPASFSAGRRLDMLSIIICVRLDFFLFVSRMLSSGC
eukprot:scaffold103243_cov18-Tisochrysis_lutea.AAC.1